MKYYICEGSCMEKYDASSKPKKDANIIFEKMGFAPFYINTSAINHNSSSNHGLKKLKKYFIYYKNYLVWKKQIKELKIGDTIVIQYPLINTIVFYSKIIRKLNRKKIKSIILIHDLESLRIEKKRFSIHNKKIEHEDKKILPKFTKIICHNEKMNELLTQYGCQRSKLINLQLFDYLDDVKVNRRNFGNFIIVAGTLSSPKAGYLLDLNKVNGAKFNLYGKGYEEKENDENVIYKGAFASEQLTSNLEGSYGLVWDGTSVEQCNGIFGDYLKYNNPYKASLYLSAGFPIIVWSQSALADFVKDNKIGISIDSLIDLNNIMENINEEEYNEMSNNVDRISSKLRKGYFLESAIKKAMEE